MGQDKSLLPFGGYSSLAQYQYDRLSKLFTHVFISTKSADKFDFTANLILDPENVDFAPTAGFVSAFTQLSCERFFVLSVDSPFVNKETIRRLLEEDKPGFDAVIAKTASGTHPMTGLYHLSLMEEFIRMLREGDHRLGKMLSMRNTHYVEFEDEKLFMNLNTPHEYHEALSHINP